MIVSMMYNVCFYSFAINNDGDGSSIHSESGILWELSTCGQQTSRKFAWLRIQGTDSQTCDNLFVTANGCVYIVLVQP